MMKIKAGSPSRKSKDLINSSPGTVFWTEGKTDCCPATSVKAQEETGAAGDPAAVHLTALIFSL